MSKIEDHFAWTPPARCGGVVWAFQIKGSFPGQLSPEIWGDTVIFADPPDFMAPSEKQKIVRMLTKQFGEVMAREFGVNVRVEVIHQDSFLDPKKAYEESGNER